MKSMRLLRAPILGLSLCMLASCATHEANRRVWSGRESPREAPQATAPPLVVETPQDSGSGGVGPASGYPRDAAQVSGAAVTSLMRQAREALDGSRPEQAASALERALRIEPRNYFVWSLLAKTYLAQGNYVQADNIAGKSNALARGNAYVELENWKTIATAREAQGDAAGEAVARDRVAELEQVLSSDMR